METNDENIYARDNEFTEIRMPEVAQSYEQFKVWAEACGHDSAVDPSLWFRQVSDYS